MSISAMSIGSFYNISGSLNPGDSLFVAISEVVTYQSYVLGDNIVVIWPASIVPVSVDTSFTPLHVINNILSNNNFSSSFELYPNPAQNTLNIDGNFESIEIYDVFGKLVFASDEKSEINIAGLANGSYYVNILTSNAVIKKKVTVAR